jgi:hypothetical protein
MPRTIACSKRLDALCEYAGGRKVSGNGWAGLDCATSASTRCSQRSWLATGGEATLQGRSVSTPALHPLFIRPASALGRCRGGVGSESRMRVSDGLWARTRLATGGGDAMMLGRTVCVSRSSACMVKRMSHASGESGLGGEEVVSCCASIIWALWVLWLHSPRSRPALSWRGRALCSRAIT